MTMDDLINTTAVPKYESVHETDITWILTSTFIIFTMQSGFGLLESGIVSQKNRANIMMKNAADVIFGGITYYLFGYGLSFGAEEKNNPFCGEGNFVPQYEGHGSGSFYANYVFQLSFATTATTIVSGGMAERVNLNAYIVFSLLNTFVYVIPVHWVWGNKGWLKDLGALDFAGSGVVHLTGGVSALIAAMLLGPRKGRYEKGSKVADMGDANQAILGMFMLWWGWLGFNAGSSFGIVEGRWMLAARAAVTTIKAAIGGGAIGTIYSYLFRKRVYSVSDLINGVLGGLVAITASCAMVQPWESFVIGGIGGLLAILAVPIVDKLKIDDPVGAFSVHGIGGIWGLLAVGIFADVNTLADVTGGQRGVIHGGNGRLLLVQLAAAASIAAWSAAVSFILMVFIRFTIGLRQSDVEEQYGADYAEHDIIPVDGIPYRANGSPVIRRHWAFTCCCRRKKGEDESQGCYNDSFDAIADEMRMKRLSNGPYF